VDEVFFGYDGVASAIGPEYVLPPETAVEVAPHLFRTGELASLNGSRYFIEPGAAPDHGALPLGPPRQVSEAFGGMAELGDVFDSHA
jgi:hypothetical protein